MSVCACSIKKYIKITLRIFYKGNEALKVFITL